MTDLRALCVELLDALESNHQTWRISVSPLVARARAALAEPYGPAVPDGREPASVVGEPSDEQLRNIWETGHLPKDEQLANDDGEEDLQFLFTSAYYRSLEEDSEAMAEHEAKCLRAVFDAGRHWGKRQGIPDSSIAQPTEREVIGPEWQPCVKLPITVHVREQRSGETHVSTREGITPVRPGDLIMRGVQGEEYPIGRELFNKTYRLGTAVLARYGNHFPDATKMVGSADALVARARAVLARPVADGPTRDELWELWLRLNNELPDRQAAVAEFWEHAQIDACVRYGPHPAPPFAGEVGELAAWLHGQDGSVSRRAIYSRAADLLLQQEGRIEQAYQYGRHDAEADAQQASESAEDEPGGLEQRQPAPVPVAEPVAEGEVGELVDRLRRASDGAGAMGWEQDSWLIARAALAAEPVAAPAGPTDEELALIYHDFCRGCEFMDQGGFEDAARALLARWGHQPAPAADGEVAELVAWLRDHAYVLNPSAERKARRICDLLERQSAPVPVLPQDAKVIEPTKHTILVPAPVPVPLSERLPGPEDCDGEGRVWLYRPQTPILNPYWDLVKLDYIDPVPPTHWLAANALPLPQGEVEK